MAAYGTVMIGKLASNASPDQWQQAMADWERDRAADGFHASYTLAGDDGRTIVSCVIFESKEKYVAVADDPEQDAWYRARVAPLLDGDPQWIDGAWI
jgi:hypothetical protein